MPNDKDLKIVDGSSTSEQGAIGNGPTAPGTIPASKTNDADVVDSGATPSTTPVDTSTVAADFHSLIKQLANEVKTAPSIAEPVQLVVEQEGERYEGIPGGKYIRNGVLVNGRGYRIDENGNVLDSKDKMRQEILDELGA